MQTVASRFPGCRIRHMSKRGAQKTGRKEMHGTACQGIAIRWILLYGVLVGNCENTRHLPSRVDWIR